ncbi:MAG TPA: nucleoside-diphosphate sugar epimerase/dehydratase [Victivallales bacterium]|nr:nucleoside-diphosphate sugar epimerase/dehydratase [Victivallales bacterium]
MKSFFAFITTAMTVTLSLLLAFYLRFEFQFPVKEISSLERAIPIFIIVKLLVFLLFRIYSGLWRYVSIYDMIQIFLANLLASLILFLIVETWHTTYFAGFSRSVIILDFILCFLAMSGKRVLVRVIREQASIEKGGGAIKTIIVGSASSANTLIHSFSAYRDRREFFGIVSDEIKPNSHIRGVKVLGKFESIANFAEKYLIDEILLLPPYSSPAAIKDVLDKLESKNLKCKLRMLPTYTDIASGVIDVSTIKNVEIEDLLGRKPIKLDNSEVAKFIKGKNVFVTGAGGSIGAELCRQIASYTPAKLIAFDISEFNIYEISKKIKADYPDIEFKAVIGDIRVERHLSNVLAEHQVDIIYHAAAYKHVPIMEENPFMAMETNVIGSANVFNVAEKYNVKRVVIISTDKAICPTSIMGASKRLSERIALERTFKNTEFVVVRFGNVLDSSGSVIPLFKEQIKKGGPVTVTSKNVVRYFMSIPEAVDLALQAGAIGKNGEIMVLDMGEPVKIYDMAKKLIELSGFIPDKDIEIKITGLRPGEKEYEELLTDEEKVHRTPYDRIFVAKKASFNSEPVSIEKISELVRKNDVKSLIELLKIYIPENKFAEAKR